MRTQFCGLIVIGSLLGIWSLAFGATWPPATPVSASQLSQQSSRTPPLSLTVTAPPMQVDEATYTFDVGLSELKVVRGVAQLRLAASIVKSAPGQMVRFREVVRYVPAESSTVFIMADGRTFALESAYPDATTPGVPARMVRTTFGQMFLGERVGIVIQVQN